MTSDKNEREDLSFYFSDDSSTEDELVRVAEKIETMHRNEEESTKELILPSESHACKPRSSPIANRRKPSDSTSFECASHLSPTVPTSVEQVAAKHFAAGSATNSDDRFEGSKEDRYDAAFAKEAELVEHAVGNKKQKENIVDLTTMENTSSSSDSLDNGSSSSDPSTVATPSGDCANSASSSSVLSDDTSEEETEKQPINHIESDHIRTNIHQHGHDSTTVTTTNACPRTTGNSIGTNQITDESMTQMKSRGSLRRPTAVLRNPYLPGKSEVVVDSNEGEPVVTNDQANQRSFSKLNIPTNAPKSYSDENDGNDNARSLRSESSNKIQSGTSTKTRTDRNGIVDKQRLEEEPASEVSRSLYAPPVYREVRPSPIVHRFDCRSHPLHSRQSISVDSLNCVFTSKIVKSFWRQKFTKFNHFQSSLVDALSHTDNNLVVSAPTGAGKSTIFELAMARFFSMDLKVQGQQGETSSSTSPIVSNARKIVYIAPSKALCEERYSDWARRLENMNLGLEVALITGQDVGSEEGANSFSDLIAAHLIVTTPEKWDSMTRRWNESFFLFASVKLLLLDEVHLLGDENRGWCLESIVTRMKTIQRAASALTTTQFEISASSYTETNPDALKSCFRAVAVSATLPNLSEVAEFLEANESYCFDDSYRPVPLTKHVNGLGRVGNNEWRFWSNLSEYVPDIIKRFSHGKQSLIFCHSKKETQKVVELLIRRNFGNRGVRTVDPPWNKPIEYMLSHGIGYHHAGMSKDERKIIEEAFLNKKIKCLAATSTLAVGVNLPAHLVIILGTKAWRNNEMGKGYQEIEVSSLLQMVGRAGRPGLDSTGVAVVLTDNSSKQRIEGLLETGIGSAKSNLISRLPEVLNSEISQQVVTSMDDVLRWLQTTFLFCSLKRNKDAVSLAQNIIHDAMRHLREIGVVESGEAHSIRPLLGCFIMNRHMVSFEQMKSITALPFDASQCQILRSMSKLENLQSFVKRNEKRELKEFHKSNLMKYRLPGALSKFIVRDPSEKAFILLQSYISRHKFKNEMLNDEQITVRDEAIKFLDVAQEYSAKASKHGKVALECYKLQRSLNYCLWGESSGVFNQFEWIGSSKTASEVLRSNGIRSFQDVLDVKEEKLDEIFAKSKILHLPKNAGRIVKHTACDLCRHRLILSTDIECTKTSNKPTDLICSLKFHDPTTAMARGQREQDLKFSLIAYTNKSKNSSLIFEENLCSPSTFRVPLPPHSFEKIFVHLVGTWVGFDQKKVIDGLNGLISSNNGTNVRTYQDPRRIIIQTDPPANSKMKKRRSPTGSSYSLDRRENEKRLCTADTEVKEPSPITPQPKDDSPGTNQQPLGGFWEEFKAVGRSSMSIASSYSVPLNQVQADVAPVSMNVTPTTHIPNKKTFLHGRKSMNLQRREVDRHDMAPNSSHQQFVTSIINDERSKMSGPGQIDRGQYKIPNSEIRQFARYESPSVAAMTKNNAKIQMHFRNERKRGSDRATEYRVKGQATNKFGQCIEYPPSTKLRPENREKIVWNRSRTKQQRAQKRAFTEKKMNPFGSFSHDPNDFERHLEQLSHQNSIIPNPLLAKMKQSTIATNGKRQNHFSTDRNRSARTVRHRPLNQEPQEVLREKAFEQQFQHEQIMSYRQNLSERSHNESDDKEPQSPLPNDNRGQSVESFRSVYSSPGYALSYPKYDERQSHFPHSPSFSGPPHLTGKEDGPDVYQTRIDGQYKPYINSLSINSDAGEFRPSINSYGRSLINSNDQLQHHPHDRCLQPSSQPSYSHLNFESDF